MTCVRQAWLELDGTTVALEDPTQGYFCQQLDLGWPTVRTVTANRPDLDGILDRTTLMGERAVTAQVIALVGAGAQVDAVAASFAPFMDPSRRPVLHYVLDRPGAPERTLTLRAAGYAWQIAGASQRDINLAWVAADPIARDPTVATATATTAAPAVISSAGDVAVRPLLRITGPITGPAVTLTPTVPPVWKLAFLSSFTIAAGHHVDIDTDARTVLADGDPAKPRLSSIDWTQSAWQEIPPAPSGSTMALSGSATTGATQVQAFWQDGYLT
jgi:hypothetical protein